MGNTGRLKNRIKNIISSGLSDDPDLELYRRIILLNVLLITAWIFLMLLGILAFIQRNIILGGMDAGMLIFLILLFWYLHNSKNISLASKIGVISIGIFYFFLFFYGGVNQTAFVWHYTYPIVSIFLLGNMWGSAAAFGLLLPVLVVFAVGDRVPWFPVYKLDLILRFVPSYISTYLLAFFMERTRSLIQHRLGRANREQQTLIEDLEAARNELREMSIKDELTGLYNRRYFNEIFFLVSKRSSRLGDVCAALMIDIDFFKKYNDRYGHLAGDDVLKQFSSILTASIRRETDFVFRYGGEEFIIILTRTNRRTAEEIAGKVFRNLKGAHIEHADSSTGLLTASIGIAINDPEEVSTEIELVKQSDRALYHAKRAGRNRYIVANDMQPSS